MIVQGLPIVFSKLRGHFRREDLIIGFAAQLVERPAEDPLAGWIGIDIAALQILHPSRAGQVPHEKREYPFTVPQRLIGALELFGTLPHPPVQFLVAFPKHVLDMRAGSGDPADQYRYEEEHPN